MTSWLDLLTSSTRNLEPPERFFYWAGLATIASIVRKNVFLSRFSYILYPNIYVILVSARSGLRKGIPISYAKNILQLLDCTRVISGQHSLPEVIDQLGKQYTTITGKVYSEAQCLLCAPEFDSFFVRADNTLTDLTDLYDTHAHEPEWEKGLKSGRAVLKQPCLNLLAGSNETLLEDIIKAKDIMGGFLARTFIVHESKRRMNNSLMWEPEGLITKFNLAEPLKRLLNLVGVFEIPEDVRHLYDDWYMELSESGLEDRTGTLERIGDSILKVAMLISLAKSNDLIIHKDTLLESIKRCEESLMGTRKVSMGQGRSDISPIVSHVLKILLDSPNQEVERSRLLDKLRCEPMQLDRALDTLIQRELIEQYRKMNTNGRPIKGIWYRMYKEVYEQYLKMRSEL